MIRHCRHVPVRAAAAGLPRNRGGTSAPESPLESSPRNQQSSPSRTAISGRLVLPSNGGAPVAPVTDHQARESLVRLLFHVKHAPPENVPYPHKSLCGLLEYLMIPLGCAVTWCHAASEVQQETGYVWKESGYWYVRSLDSGPTNTDPAHKIARYPNRGTRGRRLT